MTAFVRLLAGSLCLFAARATPDPEADAPAVLSSSAQPASSFSSTAERTGSPSPEAVARSSAARAAVWFPPGFKPSRGVHLTAWVAGAPKARRRFLERMRGTFLNTIVIPLKETDGFVYVPGVAKANEYGTTLTAIPDPEGLLRDLKAAGLHTVARIAAFNDNRLSRKRPEWAVHRPGGGLWLNDKGKAWVDPYRREIWAYIVDVAERAARLGFDEIQFDYVRFPSDGDTRLCRYARPDHTRRSASEDLEEFLKYAETRLRPTKVQLSVAVFGLTTTSKTDMGIGQELTEMAGHMDFVSPMMYPSHYAHGEYGLRNPNREPYKIIHRGLRDAIDRLGRASYKLRPYLQDFSLGYHYGPAQVRAELLAAQREGIDSWLLWNPANRYTWSALRASDGSPIRYDR